MKVTIIKKTIKEGVSPRTGNDYKIRSLFVKFTDSEIYDKIVAKLERDGASIEQIERFCKPSEYKGEVNYAFGLNCSKFTFERVQAFGELDALIDFKLNDSGYINAKIVVEFNDDTKKWEEQILSYEEPKEFTPDGEEITGWATKAPEPLAEDKQDVEVEGKKEVDDYYKYDNPPIPEIDTQTVDDLPSDN